MSLTIRLTMAQQSALECGGIEIADSDLQTVAAAWCGGSLVFTQAMRDALFSELTEMSNSEDAAAIDGPAGQMRVHARRASASLAALASRVLRA